MKKIFKLTAVCCVFLMLTACTKSRFMNLGEFIDSFNTVSARQIDYFDFIRSEENGGLCHEAYFADGVVVKLISGGDKKISECRIAAAKAGKGGEKLDMTQERFDSFISAVDSVCLAFTLGEAGDAAERFGLTAPQSLSAQCEKTAETDGFYLIYLSTPLVSEVMIYNKALHPVEPTEKPENKAPFDDIGETRGFTVPHK